MVKNDTDYKLKLIVSLLIGIIETNKLPIADETKDIYEEIKILFYEDEL